MNLVFFVHPTFLGHQSMPRFAKMLADGMGGRGHTYQVWSPQSIFSKLSSKPTVKKWLGYVDQYIIFPREIRKRLRECPANTLFVFTDQALGPWVPVVAHRPHVIHCHDFMAVRSALGEIPENPSSWTGKQYQKLIQRGFSKGKHFISVSHKTKEDLHRYLRGKAKSSDVVYNGFHQPFFPVDAQEARTSFGKKIDMDLSQGYVLHVGGNLWYKNRAGVIEIYDAWRLISDYHLPLLLVGESPTEELIEKSKASKFAKDIHWLSNIEDQLVRLAYSGATTFLFPSLGEGFGWPIAEAMASGSLVVTTNEAPMSEVAGVAGYLIARRPSNNVRVEDWARSGALLLEQIVTLSSAERAKAIAAGVENARRFNTQTALDKIEKIYSDILDGED